ncbi:hypothetical protein PSHT_10171 [Puccinia striiformis]|uniref:Uncharacterized protein n=1 Tax=Puccinia striiformis TaxID=27350 RepID=A0A2S4VBQ9_9BASI|nr:hypothetical protein PSHT_10171 [Puccinia striiformis]
MKTLTPTARRSDNQEKKKVKKKNTGKKDEDDTITNPWKKTEEEEINLEKELKMITISLTHKQPTTVADLLAQMKGIAAGTHKAVTIQAPQTWRMNTAPNPTSTALIFHSWKPAVLKNLIQRQAMKKWRKWKPKKKNEKRTKARTKIKTTTKQKKNVKKRLKMVRRTTCRRGGVTLLTKGRNALQIPSDVQSYIIQVFDPTADEKLRFLLYCPGVGLQRGQLVPEPQGEDQENEDKRQQMAREMAHGQMIANAYKRPAIFLLVFDCNTFLPLRAGPTKKCEPIYLLQVNGNHWVLALLQGKDAMKSIPPPVLATWMTTKTWLSHI